MAKKPSRQFVCRACGAVYPKWIGQCEACGEWNTLVEETAEPLAASSPRAAGKGRRVKLEGLEGMAAPPPRTQTGIVELDRVLGGGLVPASVVLVGETPVSASPRCCFRRRVVWRARASVFSIFQAKKRSIRFACALCVLALAPPRWIWQRPSM